MKSAQFFFYTHPPPHTHTPYILNGIKKYVKSSLPLNISKKTKWGILPLQSHSDFADVQNNTKMVSGVPWKIALKWKGLGGIKAVRKREEMSHCNLELELFCWNLNHDLLRSMVRVFSDRVERSLPLGYCLHFWEVNFRLHYDKPQNPYISLFFTCNKSSVYMDVISSAILIMCVWVGWACCQVPLVFCDCVPLHCHYLRDMCFLQEWACLKIHVPYY